MKGSQTNLDHKNNIVEKIGALDFMLQSLAGVHEDYKDQRDDMHKKISVRKLTLMEELYKLLSPLS